MEAYKIHSITDGNKESTCLLKKEYYWKTTEIGNKLMNKNANSNKLDYKNSKANKT